MGAEIDLRKVDDLIETRKRFFLFEKKHPDQVPDRDREGGAINEAGVVLLSATWQAFVEEVFLECSFKAFGRELKDKQLSNYRKTWKFWGNPSPDNIKQLFRRLGINDVFVNFRATGLSKEQFLKHLTVLNTARNRIAHGEPVTHNGNTIPIDLTVLSKWREIIDQGSRVFRFCALHSSGLKTGDP